MAVGVKEYKMIFRQLLDKDWIFLFLSLFIPTYLKVYFYQKKCILQKRLALEGFSLKANFWKKVRMASSKSVLSAALRTFRSFFSLQEPCREGQTPATEFVLDLKISLTTPLWL